MASIVKRYKGCKKLERCAYRGFLMLCEMWHGVNLTAGALLFALLFLFVQSRVRIGVKTSVSE